MTYICEYTLQASLDCAAMAIDLTDEAGEWITTASTHTRCDDINDNAIP